MVEIASVTPTYGGMSHARLDGDETAGRGLQWPCPSAEHPGTPILHMGEFAQGLGAFSTPDYQPSAELPDAEYPLVMMTGRILYQYNACAMTARTDGVNEIANRSFIELNTCDRGSRHRPTGTSCASRRAAAPSSPSRMCPRRRRRDIRGCRSISKTATVTGSP